MFKIENIFISLLILVSFLLNSSLIKTKDIKIFLGDSLNQEIQNSIELNKKLFLMFFARNCDYCAYSIRILKERILNHYENDDNILFGVINLDRKSNFWNGYKFNITHIPFFILIENGKMYSYKKEFEENKVVEFIEEEKNVEDALDIPEDIGLIKKANFFMASLIQKLSETFLKFGFNYKWSNAFACIIIVIAFICFIYFEHKLLNAIRKAVNYWKDWKQNKYNENINEDNKDEKGEESKEEKDNKPKND